MAGLLPTNVRVPAAVVQYNNRPLPGPMDEKDVPLNKPKKTKKKSKTAQLPIAPNVFTEEQDQAPDVRVPVAGPDYSVGADDEAEEVPQNVIVLPVNESSTSTEKAWRPGAEDNWFHKLVAPSEDELEAARNGLRWHWALEHRFMPPGSKWNETVWNGVDRENAWLAQLLRQKSAESGTMSPIAKQRELSRISGQYDKLVNEYLKGNWDDPERAYADFLTEAERLRKQYAEQGGGYDDLRLPPPVSGGRSGFTSQARTAKLREQYNFAKGVNEELASWLDVDPATGKRKIDDKKFVNEKKVYLDSVYERLLKHIKDSSNTMADEEKQRLQILVLPDNAMDEVIAEVKGFQAALRGIMSSASAKDWSQNNKGKVNKVIKAMGFDPSKDKATLGNQLATLGGVIVASLSRNDELPHDVATNLQAAKTKFDTYMKNMMLSASVAPHIVASIASLLGNTVADIYNDQAVVAGRGKADFLEGMPDISKQIPRDAMPLSELIKHSDYAWPSLAPDPGDIHASTNPESEGENNPSAAGEDVPGIRFVD